jgi:hypothetical protein
MSDINRRDTLKLASAVAALGAGLGAMLSDRSASAQTPTLRDRPDLKPEALGQIKIDSAVQLKIDGYKQIKIENGFVQYKMYSAAGQFLHAANLPEEVANLVSKGAMVQFKFFRPQQMGDKLVVSSDAFAASALTQIKLSSK